jgi:small subunit ribosomal protein S4
MKSRPTYKVCRRLGAGVYDKCQTQKYTLSEAKHSKSPLSRRRKNVSDFGKQLIEKQRVRFAYGVSERQLRKYIAEANRAAVLGVDPKVRMIEQLEMRLDNIVYKLGLAPSRRASRQMVSHGHILVNDVRTKVPSRTIYEGDIISVRKRTQTLPIMDKITKGVEEATVPTWMIFDLKKREGKVTARPTPENTEMPGLIAFCFEIFY